VTRLLAAVSVAAMTAALCLFTQADAGADPPVCPPNCDRIPGAAWINPMAIPLSARYDWPDLASVAVPQQRPRFYFEELCATPPIANDPRTWAVAARATVSHPPGQWQLAVQVIHWRGEAWYGGQLAEDVVRTAKATLRVCQATAPQVSPSLMTDEPGNLAAVISVAGAAPVVVHQYVISHPQSGSVVELAMWATSPPAESWPLVPDAQVFDVLLAPLCNAYIASCR
jgi:hypothetical protein